MKRRALVLAGALGLLAACKPPSSAPADADPGLASPTTVSADASLMPAVAASTGTGPQRLRGSALMGKDGYGLTLCGEPGQRILDLEPAAQAAFEAFLANGAREFQVDAWGQPEDNGHLRLSGVERLYVEGPGCDEKLDGFEFRAHGTEPFWGLDVDGAQLLFSRPGLPALAGKRGVDSASGGARRFEAETPEGKLVANFRPGACSDGMSDTQFGWTAEIELGGQPFKGCAYAGIGAR